MVTPLAPANTFARKNSWNQVPGGRSENVLPASGDESSRFGIRWSCAESSRNGSNAARPGAIRDQGGLG